MFGRNVNRELDKVDDTLWIRNRNKKWFENFQKKKIKYMRCMTCDELIVNDNNLISRHFRDKHIKDSTRFNETGFRIRPA